MLRESNITRSASLAGGTFKNLPESISQKRECDVRETIAIPVDLLERTASGIVALIDSFEMMGGTMGKFGPLDEIHELLVERALAGPSRDKVADR